ELQKVRFSSRRRRGVCRNGGHRCERAAIPGWRAPTRWGGDRPRGATCRGRSALRAPHTWVLPGADPHGAVVLQSVSVVPSRVLGGPLPRLWVSLSVRALRLPVQRVIRSLLQQLRLLPLPPSGFQKRTLWLAARRRTLRLRHGRSRPLLFTRQGLD